VSCGRPSDRREPSRQSHPTAKSTTAAPVEGGPEPKPSRPETVRRLLAAALAPVTDEEVSPGF
jgi:hypothetical protein